MKLSLLRRAAAFAVGVSIASSAIAQSDPTFHGLWHTHPNALSSSDGAVARVEAGHVAFDPSGDLFVLQNNKLSMFDDLAIQRRRYLVRSDVSDFVVIPSGASTGLPPDALLVSNSEGLFLGKWHPVSGWSWTEVYNGEDFAGARHLQARLRPGTSELHISALTDGGDWIRSGILDGTTFTQTTAFEAASGIRDLIALDWDGYEAQSSIKLEFAVLFSTGFYLLDNDGDLITSAWAGGGNDLIQRAPLSDGRDQLLLIAEDTLYHTGQYLFVMSSTSWEYAVWLNIPVVRDMDVLDFDDDSNVDVFMTCVSAREGWMYFGGSGGSGHSYGTRTCGSPPTSNCASRFDLSLLTGTLPDDPYPTRLTCATDADGDGDLDLMAAGDELEVTLVECNASGEGVPSMSGSDYSRPVNQTTVTFDMVLDFGAPHERLQEMNAVEISIWSKPNLSSTVTHWKTSIKAVSSWDDPITDVLVDTEPSADAIYQIRCRAVKLQTISSVEVIVDALPDRTGEWSFNSSVRDAIGLQSTAYNRYGAWPDPDDFGGSSGQGGIQPRPNGP